ncbi:hypothetical protein, partial [Klebsiella pneumoniae]|uniref:hypothetical protein n=1 Tax=Klebsiella pneumoniae TaxID=573 RepID=UPI003710D1B6
RQRDVTATPAMIAANTDHHRPIAFSTARDARATRGSTTQPRSLAKCAIRSDATPFSVLIQQQEMHSPSAISTAVIVQLHRKNQGISSSCDVSK